MVQSDITGICQDKSKRTGVTDLANMKKSLNRSLETLSKDHVLITGKPFQCLKTYKDYAIVEGDYVKALESDYVCMFADKTPTLLDGSDETILDKKNADWFADNYPYQAHASASKSIPAYFFIEGNNLVFNKSNGTYTIRFPYARLHPALISDATMIYFPNTFKMLLVFLTLADFFEDLDNDEQAGKYHAKAQTELLILGLINERDVSTPKSTVYTDI